MWFLSENGRLSISRWRSSRTGHAGRVDLNTWFSTLSEESTDELTPTTFVETSKSSTEEELLPDAVKFALTATVGSAGSGQSDANAPSGELRQRRVAPTSEKQKAGEEKVAKEKAASDKEKERPGANAFKTLVFGPFCGMYINAAEGSFRSALQLTCQLATLQSRLFEAQQRLQSKRDVLAPSRKSEAKRDDDLLESEQRSTE